MAKEVSVLPLLTKGAGISKKIRNLLPLSCAPVRLCDDLVAAEV